MRKEAILSCVLLAKKVFSPNAEYGAKMMWKKFQILWLMAGAKW